VVDEIGGEGGEGCGDGGMRNGDWLVDVGFIDGSM